MTIPSTLSLALSQRFLNVYADGLNWLDSLADMASGIDTALLEKSGSSELNRYHTRGFLVVIVTIVNWLSCISALLLIMRPGSMGSTAWAIFFTTVCVAVGTVWALIIFNLYRFLVSAVNPGDPPAEWTPQSLKSFFPKVAVTLFCSVLLGLCMAVPITVLISESDIHGELTQDQAQLIEGQHRLIDRVHANQLSDLYLDQVDAGIMFDATVGRIKSLTKARKAMKLEGQLPQPATAVDPQIDELRHELDILKTAIDARLIKIAELREQIANEKAVATKAVVGADTLWVEAGRAIQHAWVLFVGVALLLIILHASPALIRLFSSRGPYEHLVEIQNELVYARNGIAVEHAFVTDSEGHKKYLTNYAVADKCREEARTFATLARTHHEKQLQENAQAAYLRIQSGAG